MGVRAVIENLMVPEIVVPIATLLVTWIVVAVAVGWIGTVVVAGPHIYGSLNLREVIAALDCVRLVFGGGERGQ